VGVRQGLMWHGSERLAQDHYRRALGALEAGDENLALWHTDLALHCYHRFYAAIRLKERILRERAWDDDGAAGRSFLYQLMARERGYDLPWLGRPTIPSASPDPTDAPVLENASDAESTSDEATDAAIGDGG